MATFSDVQTALQSLVMAAVYPNGINNPSVANVGIRIETGWPTPSALDQRLQTGKALVSIYQPTGMGRNVTRFFPEWKAYSVTPAQLTLTITGNTITVGGAINAGEIAIIIVNKNNANSYSYTVQTNDTFNTIASALTALIPNSSVIDNVITVLNAYNIVGRISTQSTIQREEKRQKKIFWLIVWAPTPAIRDLISDAIDLAIPLNPYINLPDGTGARIIYEDVADRDTFAKTSAYRRDFIVSVEYATTQNSTVYTVENSVSPIQVTS